MERLTRKIKILERSVKVFVTEQSWFVLLCLLANPKISQRIEGKVKPLTHTESSASSKKIKNKQSRYWEVGEIKPRMLRFENIETWMYPPWGYSTLGIFNPLGFFTPNDFSPLLIIRPGISYIKGHFTETIGDFHLRNLFMPDISYEYRI